VKPCALAFLLLLSGCATRHGRCYPVIGLGWHYCGTNQPGSFQQRTSFFGLGWFQQPVGQFVLGYQHSQLLSVTTNTIVDK